MCGARHACDAADALGPLHRNGAARRPPCQPARLPLRAPVLRRPSFSDTCCSSCTRIIMTSCRTLAGPLPDAMAAAAAAACAAAAVKPPPGRCALPLGAAGECAGVRERNCLAGLQPGGAQATGVWRRQQGRSRDVQAALS